MSTPVREVLTRSAASTSLHPDRARVQAVSRTSPDIVLEQPATSGD